MENKQRRKTTAKRLKWVTKFWGCSIRTLITDGFSAQEEDEEGDQWLFLVGYFFFTSRVTCTVRKKAFAVCICLCYHTHIIKSLKILMCNIFLCKYLILQCGHPWLIIRCGLYKYKMDFLFKIRGCSLYSGPLYSLEFTVVLSDLRQTWSFSPPEDLVIRVTAVRQMRSCPNKQNMSPFRVTVCS